MGFYSLQPHYYYLEDFHELHCLYLKQRSYWTFDWGYFKGNNCIFTNACWIIFWDAYLYFGHCSYVLSSYSSIPALETTTMCCMYIICPDKFACNDFRMRKHWLFLYTSIYNACFSFIVGTSYLMHFNYMILWLWIIGGAWFWVLEHSRFWCSGFCFPFPSF